MYLVYRLYIGDQTIYIGKTRQNINQRYIKHKNHCFSQTRKEFNNYKYLCIRQIGITKDNFYEYVKIQSLYENVPVEYNKKMEQLIMDLYKDFGSNLWNTYNTNYNHKEYQKNYQKTSKRKEYEKKYYEINKEKNKKKINCNICNLELSRSSLLNHKKIKH